MDTIKEHGVTSNRISLEPDIKKIINELNHEDSGEKQFSKLKSKDILQSLQIEIVKPSSIIYTALNFGLSKFFFMNSKSMRDSIT